MMGVQSGFHDWELTLEQTMHLHYILTFAVSKHMATVVFWDCIKAFYSTVRQNCTVIIQRITTSHAKQFYIALFHCSSWWHSCVSRHHCSHLPCSSLS